MTDRDELILEIREGAYQPEPGAYVCRILQVEPVDTKLGRAIRITVKSDSWPSEWSFIASQRLSKRSKLGQLLTAMGYELKVGTAFDLRSIVGKEVAILIGKNDRGYSRPQAFLSLKDKVPF